MGESVWPDGRTSQDWYSVAGLMMEMERALGCSLRLEMYSDVKKGRPELVVYLRAFPMGSAYTAVEPLASVSCRCSALGLATLQGVITFLLYQMDFQFEQVDGEKPVNG